MSSSTKVSRRRHSRSSLPLSLTSIEILKHDSPMKQTKPGATIRISNRSSRHHRRLRRHSYHSSSQHSRTTPCTNQHHHKFPPSASHSYSTLYDSNQSSCSSSISSGSDDLYPQKHYHHLPKDRKLQRLLDKMFPPKEWSTLAIPGGQKGYGEGTELSAEVGVDENIISGVSRENNAEEGDGVGTKDYYKCSDLNCVDEKVKEQHWIQNVSLSPANDEEISHLSHVLEETLKSKNMRPQCQLENETNQCIQKIYNCQPASMITAENNNQYQTIFNHINNETRDNYVCPTRMAILQNVMDEIIRQVTIDNPTRGSMLYQIQNELTGYCNTYKSLYESSITFGIRKALCAQQTQESMQSMLKELHRENQMLKEQKHREESQHIEERRENSSTASSCCDDISELDHESSDVDSISVESENLDHIDEVLACD